MPTPALTVVEDVLYDPTGDPVNGRLYVTNTSSMISPDGEEIPEGTTLFFPVINGRFSFGLVPNLAGTTPNGTSYSVKYQVTMQWFNEVWVIPEFPNPCRLSDVRALTPPIPDLMIPIAQVLAPSGIVPGQILEWDGHQWVPGSPGVTNFGLITSGTNTTAEMIIGPGASLKGVVDCGTWP